MLHFVYKTTNTINGKIYVGVHSTENPNDRYLGSGKCIRRALKKYGRKKFVKKILKCFETRDDALLYEAEIVDDDFVKRKDTYNLALGGKSGDIKTGKDHPFYGKHHSTKSKKKMSERKKELYKKEGNPFYGKKHSDETKSKISKNRKGKMSGEDHPLYGTKASKKTRRKQSLARLGVEPWNKGRINNRKWINKDGKTKMVPPDEVEIYIKKGWNIGRGKVK